ncbi:MAG: amidohydrolase [Betaproteobacteria bacterium]|nr:MAG: amidohydrolase [Betaproteobacteria bacterium]
MIIDVFNHFMPKSIFERLLWDVEARLRMMDEFEGLQQVLSLANPPIEMLGPSEKTPELARIANDGLAELCRKYPDRFPAFIASMPMNNVDACVREADRAIVELGAKGIQIFTNVLGRPLSAPEFRPIFRNMVKHDLPVWIHPIRGPQFSDYASEKASENEIWFTFGWPYETTACVTRLIFSGIYFYAGKIDLGFDQIFHGRTNENPMARRAGLKKRPVEYYRMLYGDTALNGSVAATRCGHAFFTTGHCVFATDAPFDAEKGRMLIRETINAVNGLEIPKAEKDRIFAGNARALLKLNG